MTFQEGEVPDMDKAEGIIDILLIGVDNRDVTKFTGRSDVMMLLRIDTDKKELKLASFMRDTLVTIEGHDKNKLNTAYNFGSIELTYKTYKANFGLLPDHYMVVNFYGMEDIINALDGVDIDIQSKEIDNMNKSIREINALDSGSDSRIFRIRACST